ncbi:SAM-dependent methyltransferase [Chelativorans intermedius]|uniref:SAM-dependent methyltransferase n=1 Tax=Chelativorans intermedius TaxID=515947 RepID=A0ABV6D2S5_9HYPH|nr:cyclopropane-fatty-acyl-phospholipid synthase family protein [Chelativorans intermedius]MCT8997240.1 cyclopropane-fatty-acyl-phospholipid synthase family protein [Chelativorans intermedius]
MNLSRAATGFAEQWPVPDAWIEAGIAGLVSRTRRRLAEAPDDATLTFARAMDDHPIAEHPEAANAQHYALPPAFFRAFLGPRMKYSCCLYPGGGESLAEAEVCALEETVLHADLHDGQRILELGCGWGSLTLFMAERFPSAQIVAVSNAASQGEHIRAEARRLGLNNVTVLTADMNAFQPRQTFDRVVSVEMFEHMANWRALLERVRGWVRDDGRVFIHVFSHRQVPYRFDHRNRADWIAQHFFTGGIMPSHSLIGHFPDLFEVERDWRWNGLHYARTARQWLSAFDENRAVVDPILERVYGREARLWHRRWRLFFLATAGLFGHGDGLEWGVSHYLLRPAAGLTAD